MTILFCFSPSVTISRYTIRYLFKYFLLPGAPQSSFSGRKDYIPSSWKRTWQPTPVFLPREPCGERSLRLWVRRVGHDWSDLAYMHALEKEMATHSSILAWRIPGTEQPGALPYGVAQSQTWLRRLSIHARIGEGNGNPLQCSCLENPRDGGAWWAAVYGVTRSWTEAT